MVMHLSFMQQLSREDHDFFQEGLSRLDANQSHRLTYEFASESRRYRRSLVPTIRGLT